MNNMKFTTSFLIEEIECHYGRGTKMEERKADYRRTTDVIGSTKEVSGVLIFR